MLDGRLPEALALGVGATKSSDVTLKQGTLMEKLIVSTKVWVVSVTLKGDVVPVRWMGK